MLCLASIILLFSEGIHIHYDHFGLPTICTFRSIRHRQTMTLIAVLLRTRSMVRCRQKQVKNNEHSWINNLILSTMKENRNLL